MRVLVRGAGDLASGIIYKLVKCSFDVLAIEIDCPSSIRRHVSFSEAVYHGTCQIEDVVAVKVDSFDEAREIFAKHQVAVMVDRNADILKSQAFDVVVDAILAKKNLGTTIDMAPVVIGVGPGFEAGKDCHYVVETKRGHHLGRIYESGCAIPNTGIPGDIQGFTKERVVHSPYAGTMQCVCHIKDIVKKGETIALVDGHPVAATMDGLLRGILPDGFPVTRGLKMADIDPRVDQIKNCDTISDKARCIAGGVLEAILRGSSI